MQVRVCVLKKPDAGIHRWSFALGQVYGKHSVFDDDDDDQRTNCSAAGFSLELLLSLFLSLCQTHSWMHNMDTVELV